VPVPARARRLSTAGTGEQPMDPRVSQLPAR
jgi:hypothetical protein